MAHSPIVFTDLDGTLLDHASYRYDAAIPALEYLREQGIPLVLCSSKTAAEILLLRKNPLLRDCAAIVENGGGVLEADARYATPAPTHQRLMSLVDSLPAELRSGFDGFSNWDTQTLVANTGLSRDSAIRARRRDYTEPGLWLGDDESRQRFVGSLEKLGVCAQQGGRFLTLGFATNKATLMLEMIAAYRASRVESIVAIALGDAPNDIEMLERADFGIIVPNPAHCGIPVLAGESRGRIKRAQAAGPAGWSASLLHLLENPDFTAAEV